MATLVSLPTLQRNALRKLLERPDFTPAEVAELGFRRLQLARGLGCKGLHTVLAWLRHHGYELEPFPARSSNADRRSRRIQHAIHLLQSAGFVVLPATVCNQEVQSGVDAHSDTSSSGGT